jgi:hypothetical protein
VDGLQVVEGVEVIKILELRHRHHLMLVLVVEEKVLKDQHQLGYLEYMQLVAEGEAALGMVQLQVDLVVLVSL